MTWLILATLVSIPLGHLTRLELGNAIAVYLHDVTTLLMFAAVLLQAIVRKKFPEGKLLRPSLAFTGVAILSLLVNVAKVEASQAIVGSLYLLRWVALFGVYLSLVTYAKQRDRLTIFGRSITFGESLLIVGLVLATFGVAQYLLVPDLRSLKWLGWDDHYFRLVGTILDPSMMGMLLVLIFFLGLQVKLPPAVKVIAVCLPLAALLLTYSRASYLALLAGGGVYMGIHKRYKISLILGMVFLILIPLLPRPGGEGVNLKRWFSAEARLRSWRNSLAIIQDAPYLGVGFNLYRYAQGRYGFLDEDWLRSHGATGVENSYLFVLATTGTLGLVTFIWLLVKMFQLGQKNPDDSVRAGILASLTAVSVHALFNNTWFYPFLLIWIWALLGVSEGNTRSIRG